MAVRKEEKYPVTYAYEPKRNAQNRKIKHHWEEDRAGFVTGEGGHIEGKCPSGISSELAERLLNEGESESPPGWRKSHPKMFFNIHEGVIYKALETNPGRSYHAFPCRGPRSNDMTARMKDKLLEVAKRKNCLSAIEKWFEDNP